MKCNKKRFFLICPKFHSYNLSNLFPFVASVVNLLSCNINDKGQLFFFNFFYSMIESMTKTTSSISLCDLFPSNHVHLFIDFMNQTSKHCTLTINHIILCFRTLVTTHVLISCLILNFKSQRISL